MNAALTVVPQGFGLTRAVRRMRALPLAARLGIAAVAGASTALAHAPYFVWPLIFIAYPVLVWLLDGAFARRRTGQAMTLAFAFGFGLNLAQLYWIGFAFTVNAEAHAWLLPFVAILFPGGLALFPVLAVRLAGLFWRRGPERLLGFIFFWSLALWLQGHLFTGFPWTLPAYVWLAHDALAQAASLVGAYALSALTIAMAVAPAALADTRFTLAWRIGPTAAALGLIAAMVAYGGVRLAYASPAAGPERIRIVQPNVPQAEKYRRDLVRRNWERLITLTGDADTDGIDIVVWPEAAPPFILLDAPQALEQIAGRIGSARLVTGAVRRGTGPDEGWFFNAAHVLGPGGAVQATYDKHHLVPFGEYMPFAATMEALGITKITGQRGSFAEGPGPATLSPPGLPPVAILICYEAIFPAAVRAADPRPDWFAHITDDSWFANTSGPRQHLAIARLRAIENGVPVIRSANTGLSAAIDAYGRVIARLPYGEDGRIDVARPLPIQPTVYGQLGEAFLWLFLAGVGLIVVYLRSRV